MFEVIISSNQWCHNIKANK